MIGTLYLVSTHIGNPGDVTLRAKRLIADCDLLICEEIKPARKLLKELHLFKEIIPLNEHNEREVSSPIIELLKTGKKCCLISDAGTPVFSDPGNFLINLAFKNKIPVSIVPGPDSLIPALIISGFDISKFYFAGWLSSKSDERKNQLARLKSIKTTIALMDTPYRLKQTLRDVSTIFGQEKIVSLACDLTTDKENILRGKVGEINNIVNRKSLKCEFVLVIENN